MIRIYKHAESDFEVKLPPDADTDIDLSNPPETVGELVDMLDTEQDVLVTTT
jgi:hypothetical protein